MTAVTTSPSLAAADQPLRGAGFGQAFRRFWSKYATFSGRASRSEFWWWVLANVLISIVLAGVVIALSGGVSHAQGSNAENTISGIWGVVTLLPTLALNARRLHDTNRSGWWQLLHLVPLVGSIVLLVWFLSGPKPAGSRFDRTDAVR